MEKLIPLISDLHQLIRKSQLDLQINLPMIAVVGSQSTGKSSVLQSIIGKQFLPKGKGIVTRRPIQIQLCQIASEKEYAQFVERKEDYYQDMHQFKKDIELETEKLCGTFKGISQIPLRIRYYSKNVLDMLLVDLPGIIKNPIGDQPRDIEDQVLAMIKSYIRNPNCIIVAVSKATDDSANSQSLKIARQVDKQGKRTIGVLTQVDLVDKSINVLKDYSILSNSLSLGHVCVFLRSAKSELSLSQQAQKQRQFFQSHPQYGIISEQMGIKYLTKLMNTALIRHIKSDIPTIRQKLIKQFEKTRSKYIEYGSNQQVHDKKSKGIIILSLVSKYSQNFKEMIEGRSLNSKDSIIGGARIQHIFSQIFIRAINQMNPFEFLTDTEIRTAIKNANGLRKALFLPESAFQTLVRTQICRLKLPSIECAQLIHQELRRIIHSIRLPQISRYENLSFKIFDVMESLLLKSLKKTEQMIRNLIEIELGYINTNHPDFIDVISLVKQQPQKQNPGQLSISSVVQRDYEEKIQNPPSLVQIKKCGKNRQEYLNQSEILDSKLKKFTHFEERPLKKQQPATENSKATLHTLFSSYTEHDLLPRYRLPGVPSLIKIMGQPNLRQKTETEMVKRLIISYFNVVKKNINDSVPKTIITMLVRFCGNQCQRTLISNLYVESEFDILLEEKEEIIKERKRLQSELQVLKECLNMMNQIESKISV